MFPEQSAAVLLVLMLAALVDPAPTDLPAEVPSGAGEEEGVQALSESPLWRLLLDATHRHKQEFEKEFPDPNQYQHLDNFNIASFPEGCRNASINLEGCLKRLVRALHVYQVLLRHVEREYPLSEVLPNVKSFSGPLISAAKQKMRKPEAVKTLSRGQEDSLLKEVNHSDSFHRKMLAHNILRKLHEFLRDTHIDIKRREKRPGYLLLA